jgi:ribosomal-protein-alanine N-acetyltransferase
MTNDIFLDGTHVYLRALTEQDVQGNYSTWLNDPEITRYNSHGRFPMTVDKLLNYVTASKLSDSDLVLAVVNKLNSAHIGNISLQNINWIDRNAELAFLLGDKSYWGKGVMFEAGSLLINHGFKLLNLHRIYCGTSAENLGMQKLAIKLGMEKEGVRKQAIFKNGKYIDILEYGMVTPNI